MAFLKEIQNPLTENYLYLKQYILSDQFTWKWCQSSTNGPGASGYTNVPFYGHCILERPNHSREAPLYSRVRSDLIDVASNVIKEIFLYNQIDINCVFRINANCIHRVDSNQSVPHIDHDFPHKNFLIYLNTCAGDTLVYDNDDKVFSFTPKEDSVILFDGCHSAGQPEIGERRVVFVATYY